MAFAGFPRDTLYTPTPDPLFGPLLEEIHDIAELKVALRGLWLLHHKRQSVRAVSLDEFLADTSLLRGLRPATVANPSTSSEQTGTEHGEAAEEIRRGLRLAVRRGIFLAHEAGLGRVYFALNNDAGRRAIARMKQMGESFDQLGRAMARSARTKPQPERRSVPTSSPSTKTPSGGYSP